MPSLKAFTGNASDWRQIYWLLFWLAGICCPLDSSLDSSPDSPPSSSTVRFRPPRASARLLPQIIAARRVCPIYFTLPDVQIVQSCDSLDSRIWKDPLLDASAGRHGFKVVTGGWWNEQRSPATRESYDGGSSPNTGCLCHANKPYKLEELSYPLVAPCCSSLRSAWQPAE